jgi:hypothetical protein
VSRATQAGSVEKKNKYNTRTEQNTRTMYITITCTIQEHEKYNTQKKNSNREQYDLTEQKISQNATDRRTQQTERKQQRERTQQTERKQQTITNITENQQAMPCGLLIYLYLPFLLPNGQQRA